MKAALQREGRRFLRFAVVGLSGVAVNEGVFVAVYRALAGPEALRVNVAGVLGFITSVTTNFLLNDRWTWGDRPKVGGLRGALRRYRAYVTVALGGLGVQLLVLNLLVHTDTLGPKLANLVGIAAGTSVNYLANHLWTFRHRAADGQQD